MTSLLARATLRQPGRPVPFDSLFNVRAFGAKGDGVTDDTVAVQQAISEAVAAGGGIVFLPRGTYVTTAPLTWKSKVSLFGHGPGVSVLKPTGDVRGTILNSTDYTVASPMLDVVFADFEIDGTAMTSNDGVYRSLYKGFYIKYMKRCHWRNVYVHSTGATGFGADFMVDCTFVSCSAVSCGRLNNGAEPGGAGFGIGTGGSTDEHVVLSGCTARNNRRSGIFFERQSAPNDLYTNYAKVVNCHVAANQQGVVNAGVYDFHVRGNTIVSSQNEGVGLRAFLTSSFGTRTLITDNTISANSGSGVEIDLTGIATGSHLLRTDIRGNQIRGNGLYGIRCTAPASVIVRELVVQNNHVNDNGYSGVHLTGSTGSYVDTAVQGNMVRANGAVSGSVNYGIYIGAPMTRMLVTGNSVSANTGPGFATGTVTLTDSKVELNQFKGNTGASTSTAGATLTGSTITNNVV